jgi:hypothetical protein
MTILDPVWRIEREEPRQGLKRQHAQRENAFGSSGLEFSM